MEKKDMKDIKAPETNNDNTVNESGYWRSFKELYKDPSFDKALKNEFSPEALQKPEVDKMSAVTRRRFLALMGASAAFAAAGCNNYQDKGFIYPYNNKPEEVILGLPNFLCFNMFWLQQRMRNTCKDPRRQADKS